ncbi:MAG: DUF4339 domain-containing protein [Bacteriovoracaceae bacterium]
MNWFVINENEHLGPFEEEVLKQLFKSGDLKGGALVWKEGMSDPKPFSEVFLKQDAKKDTNENLDKNLEQGLDEEDEDDEDELPPELPPEALKPRPEKKERAKSSAREVKLEVYEEDKQNKQKQSFWSTLKFALASVGIIGIVGFSWMYYSTHFKTFSRPSKMGYNDFERLKQASVFRGDKTNLAFSLAKDKSKVWMATNVPYTGEVVLKLSSVPDKILANDSVVLTAKGELKGRLAEFDSFEFERGQRIIEGWYQVEAVTPRRLEVPIAAKLLSSRNRQFRYIDEILLTTMEKSAFDQALKQFALKQNQNDSVFWEELKQKYETIKAMAGQIHASMKMIFQSNGRDWSQRVDMFEQEYTQNYGAFFTNFVIENEKAYEDLKEKDFNDKLEVISNYTRLTRLAKQVGLATMDSLDELRRLKEPEGPANRNALRKKIDARFEKMLEIAEEKLRLMQTK